MNGKKNLGEKFRKIWVYLARLASFWKFWKMLQQFHSLLEIAENSNRTFSWMESAQLFTIILRPDRDRLCFTDGKHYL